MAPETRDYSPPLDYSALDTPEIISSAFYPRQEWSPAPMGAVDYMIPVANNVFLSSRLYPAQQESSGLLYFHGNGEIACDYDNIAPVYNQLGISLFVADYRGYGKSTGVPTFTNMVQDSTKAFDYFLEKSFERNPDTTLFIMGRSLGCISAMEVTLRRRTQISGLIVDSGVANAARFAGAIAGSSPEIDELSKQIAKQTKRIIVPTLIIHGQQDTLIPPQTAYELYRNIGSREKWLEMIPNAGHNDIIYNGARVYFTSIMDFIYREGS